MALQDLGSSKHQGELHTLGLLILLHRFRSLDLDAIDRYVDPEQFDARRFFIHNSRPLTFEDLEAWSIPATAADLTRLVSANDWQELLTLNSAPSRLGRFPARDNAIEAVLTAVLQAVWTIPSLGTPILYESQGVDFIRVGYFVAPLDLLMEDSDTLHRHLASRYQKHRTTLSYAEFLNFTVCDTGFVDLRPHAILSGARTYDEAAGRVLTLSTEETFVAALDALPPYTYFTTCGLLAVLFRLRELYASLSAARIELGTACDFRWQMPRDKRGHILVLPGACEAFRMVSEGLEKGTGVERLDGYWGYRKRLPRDRRAAVIAAVQARHHREAEV
jgi:hypothetical protein